MRFLDFLETLRKIVKKRTFIYHNYGTRLEIRS